MTVQLTQDQQATHDRIMGLIGSVASAERVTKSGLSTLSRDMLRYIVDTQDVRPVNALLGKDDGGSFLLTPVNWRIAVQYFHHFLPFTSNYDKVKEFAVQGKGVRTELVFHKKSKKRWDKCIKAIEEWLADEGNDIWAWSNNAEMDAKPVDYAKQIQSTVKKAMDEGKGNMGLTDVMAAIAELEDVSIYDLMGAMEAMRTPEAEQEAA